MYGYVLSSSNSLVNGNVVVIWLVGQWLYHLSCKNKLELARQGLVENHELLYLGRGRWGAWSLRQLPFFFFFNVESWYSLKENMKWWKDWTLLTFWEQTSWYSSSRLQFFLCGNETLWQVTTFFLSPRLVVEVLCRFLWYFIRILFFPPFWWLLKGGKVLSWIAIGELFGRASCRLFIQGSMNFKRAGRLCFVITIDHIVQ